MNDQAEKKDDDLVIFDIVKVTISCSDGDEVVSAMTHPNAPGLAVVQCKDFDRFNVTHMPSGMIIGGYSERAWTTAIYLAEFQKMADDHEFSWDMDQKGVKAVIEEKGEDICEGNKFSLNARLGLLRSDSFAGEFPWEDEHPGDIAINMLNGIVDDESDHAKES